MAKRHTICTHVTHGEELQFHVPATHLDMEGDAAPAPALGPNDMLRPASSRWTAANPTPPPEALSAAAAAAIPGPPTRPFPAGAVTAACFRAVGVYEAAAAAAAPVGRA